MRSYLTNVKQFCKETTLHGLKYIVDDTISSWERFFFFCAFIAAFTTTVNLISNVYGKWESTPVIIGVSPYPTSILDIPFPAITVCNMNTVQLSKVSNYTEESYENAILKLLCSTEHDETMDYSQFKNTSLKTSEFLIEKAQPCSKLLLWCKFGGSVLNCSDLFREVLTDEGVCCTFNTLHPTFLYKHNTTFMKELTNRENTLSVDWSLEKGYGKPASPAFNPMPGKGSGISMGLSIVLNADLDEYYCSSTNGPGFKILLHNPIDSPNMKETGLSVAIGSETRFRIDTSRSEAADGIRSVHRTARQCLFNDEEKLIYYKYYTRRNCENECEAMHLFNSCKCIPYNLPLLFPNVSVCSLQQTNCVRKSQRDWSELHNTECKKRCLPSCFDLSFFPVAFSYPLAENNYSIPNTFLENFDKQFLEDNIASVQIYYRESVFHGDLKNVYIGLTEFLSNIGGVMSLFMGFSFISVAEIIYFMVLSPIKKLCLKHINDRIGVKRISLK